MPATSTSWAAAGRSNQTECDRSHKHGQDGRVPGAFFMRRSGATFAAAFTGGKSRSLSAMELEAGHTRPLQIDDYRKQFGVRKGNLFEAKIYIREGHYRNQFSLSGAPCWTSVDWPRGEATFCGDFSRALVTVLASI